MPTCANSLRYLPRELRDIDLDVEHTTSVLELQHRARVLHLGSCKLALNGQVISPTVDMASSGVEAEALITLIVGTNPRTHIRRPMAFLNKCTLNMLYWNVWYGVTDKARPGSNSYEKPSAVLARNIK